jgi:enolase-phosphatase E1
MRAILLDIEGTTTPISFVHEILFPYSRDHLQAFLASQKSEVSADLEMLEKEHAADRSAGTNPPSLIEPYLHWLIEQDRKSPALKSLQGKIWEQGYKDGSLHAPVFTDVPRAMRRWRDAGMSVNIFSSGSVLAQKLLFKHTNAGDLSQLIDAYFDTSTGPKTDANSYLRIAAKLDCRPVDIQFVSDIVAELDAANTAGMQTALCVRPGNRTQPNPERYQLIESLDAIQV